jgi:GTPase-associated protein 1, N-terminal domain type 1
VTRADQFLFGYENGHRLLAGSRELPAAALVRLLGATDTAMSPGCAPLVTALPLVETEEYAFCVTWSAPERPRAGAVWAHVLVAAQASLTQPLALEALFGLPRRPPSSRPLELAGYSAPLALDAALAPPPSYLPDGAPGLGLLERLVRAAYRTRPRPLVASEDLGEAAAALLALWSAQWPELRGRFAFCTRERVGAERAGFDLTVAAQVHGGEATAVAPAERPPSRWVSAVAGDARSVPPSGLRTFLGEFGPHEPPQPLRLRRLAALWVHVQWEDVKRVRRALERHWPTAADGRELKLALFGAGNEAWWRLGERERVSALQHSDHRAWDIDDLAIPRRADALAGAPRREGDVSSSCDAPR